jgi:hypothetical protein
MSNTGRSRIRRSAAQAEPFTDALEPRAHEAVSVSQLTIQWSGPRWYPRRWHAQRLLLANFKYGAFLVMSEGLHSFIFRETQAIVLLGRDTVVVFRLLPALA